MSARAPKTARQEAREGPPPTDDGHPVRANGARGAKVDPMPAADVDTAAALADCLELRGLSPGERRRLGDDLRAVLDALGEQNLPRDRGLRRRLLDAADVLAGQ